MKRFIPAGVHETLDYATCGLWFSAPSSSG